MIEALSRDTNGNVREYAARALGAVGAEASTAAGALVDALRYGDEGYAIATSAEIALSQIGPAAVPALIAALKCDRLGPKTPINRYNPITRHKLSPKPPTSEIENVRVGAAQALVLMGPPGKAAAAALTEALNDEHPRVRERAAQALKEIQR